MDPIISIIIPVKDEEKVIEKTIRQFSVVSIPHEVIVSDGGSSDKTIELAKKYADHVYVWPGQGRQTIAAGRNAGARLARGKYVVFLDADCHMDDPKHFFEVLLAQMEANSELGVVTVKIKTDPKYETVADKLVWGYMNYYNRLLNNVLHIGGGCEFYMFSNMLFQKIGGFREDLVAAEDYDIFMRMAKVAKTRLEPSLTVYHTGRHSRKIGWPKLLWTWFINMMSLIFRDRSYSKVWKEVR
jgi:glycosyltransferase involved in cell wall biosynthesis